MQVNFSGTVYVQKVRGIPHAETWNNLTRDILKNETTAFRNRIVETDEAIVRVFSPQYQMEEAAAMLQLAKHEQPFYRTGVFHNDDEIRIMSRKIYGTA